jgi:hypothetical protein
MLFLCLYHWTMGETQSGYTFRSSTYITKRTKEKEKSNYRLLALWSNVLTTESCAKTNLDTPFGPAPTYTKRTNGDFEESNHRPQALWSNTLTIWLKPIWRQSGDSSMRFRILDQVVLMTKYPESQWRSNLSMPSIPC